jgi:hypothetical protein
MFLPASFFVHENQLVLPSQYDVINPVNRNKQLVINPLAVEPKFQNLTLLSSEIFATQPITVHLELLKGLSVRSN